MNHREYKNKSQVIWVCVLLAVVTFAVYWQVVNHDFIDFDDDLYVTRNLYVRDGLTLKGIHWAFSFKDKEKTYWHPLTWLSHMVDCQLFGLRPGLHHLTNLLFHIINGILLFLVLMRMTGVFWRSALVAALFALHPINVDSVAWIAERKNLLSTFFWMLTILTYTLYTERPHFGLYLLTLLVFTFGLMAKPMLVTLPFVLLLLDYWPLGRIGFDPPSAMRKKTEALNFSLRFDRRIFVRLLLEKLPFIFLSMVSTVISSLSVKDAGNIISTHTVPVTLRFSNALVSYIKYILKMLWPQNFAVFYPYPKMVPMWHSLGALTLICFVSILFVRAINRRPYLGIGWCWYLGTLFPVMGLVQVGLWPAMADRFAYIPLIGVFVIIAWGVHDLTLKWKYRFAGQGIIAAVLIFFLMGVTWNQIQYWENSISIYKHTLSVTTENDIIHNNMGVILVNQNKISEAIDHYNQALKINPGYVRLHNNLGAALIKAGRNLEAIHHFSKALRLKPDYAEAHNNLGNALIKTGRNSEAIRHFSEALRIKPDYAEAHNDLVTFKSVYMMAN